MPRQPYTQVVPTTRLGNFDVGVNTIGERPNLEALVGNCLMAWPHVEAEMALLLGQLLNAQNPAAVAVFQTLRRSTAQRDAISAAASASLNSKRSELVYAVLNLHKAIEAERNALAHGHFGTSSEVPDGLLWMNTSDYVEIRTIITLLGETIDEPKRIKIANMLFVYKENDLIKFFIEIKDLAEIWFTLINYLKLIARQSG